jgi:hypothetical protein
MGEEAGLILQAQGHHYCLTTLRKIYLFSLTLSSPPKLKLSILDTVFLCPGHLAQMLLSLSPNHLILKILVLPGQTVLMPRALPNMSTFGFEKES